MRPNRAWKCHVEEECRLVYVRKMCFSNQSGLLVLIGPIG